MVTGIFVLIGCFIFVFPLVTSILRQLILSETCLKCNRAMKTCFCSLEYPNMIDLLLILYLVSIFAAIFGSDAYREQQGKQAGKFQGCFREAAYIYAYGQAIATVKLIVEYIICR